MRPQLFALMTAMAWGFGGYFEKKGLHLGNLSPQMGITLRTAVAVVLLGLVSFPQWKTVTQAGPRALLYMVLGGGVVAGVFPIPCLAALLAVPLLVASGRCAVRTYESPRDFIPAVRSIVTCYMVAVLLFTAGILWPAAA